MSPSPTSSTISSSRPAITQPLILTRLYHRQLPHLATEPTSTLLLITPLNRFLDLRFSRTTPTPTLLSGSAGTYIRTATSGVRGHTIATTPVDGSLHSLHLQQNGDILERGADYEAVWRITDVVPRVVVALVLQEEGGVGVVVRVGSWCQGLLVVGGEVTAERWFRLDGEGWRRVLRVGQGWVPCGVACVDRDEERGVGGRYWKEARGLGFVVEKVVGEGDRVVCEGREWEVVERGVW